MNTLKKWLRALALMRGTLSHAKPLEQVVADPWHARNGCRALSWRELARFCRRPTAIAPLLLIANLHPLAQAAEKTPADLVLVHQGTLPIILTVPHGGREAIPGVRPRNLDGKSQGGRWGGFEGGGDFNTDILAQGIAAEIKALTGKELYLVMAKFPTQIHRPQSPAGDSVG